MVFSFFLFGLGKASAGAFRDNFRDVIWFDPGPDRAHSRAQPRPVVLRHIADTEAGFGDWAVFVV